jgi:pimeloyl-ACP methyl ester carboxylesterase
MTPERSSTIALSDGRRLGYAEYGDPAGEPWFYFHGTPGSRFEARFAHDAATRHHVRLIAVDRPGFGLSDFQPRRRIRDWPADVAQLAGHLGIERFGVIGLSGGGPHALACALAMPERVNAAALVSSAAPIEAYIARSKSAFGRLLQRALLPFVRFWMWLLVLWMSFILPRVSERWVSRWPDRRVLSRPEARRVFRDELVEGLRPGHRGAAHEFALHTRPWRLDLARVAGPVFHWHGEDDVVVRPDVARYLAARIPGVRSTFIPAAGHLLIADEIDAILGAVTAAARATPAAVARGDVRR